MCIFSVSNYKSPLSIQTPNGVCRKQLHLSCLIPYIKKGREMRTERSVMYKTPHKDNVSSIGRASKNSKLKTRNLSNIRQHLFSRDSISSQDDIFLSGESINLTGNFYTNILYVEFLLKIYIANAIIFLEILEKFVTTCTTLNSNASKSHIDKQQQNNAIDTQSKKSVASVTEPLVDSMKTESEITTRQIDQCSSIGGGDGPSIKEPSKSYSNIQRLNHNTEVTKKILFSD